MSPPQRECAYDVAEHLGNNRDRTPRPAGSGTGRECAATCGERGEVDHCAAVEIEVSRNDSPSRWFSAPEDAGAGEALDALGAEMGLTNATGAVQARSLLTGSWVERAARLPTLGCFVASGSV